MGDNFPFTNYVSTRWYRAPEWVLNSTTYDSAVDVFAIGWVMAEMYQLKPIFWGKTSLDQLTKYWKILGTTEFMQWKEGVKISQNMGFEIPEYEHGWLADKLGYSSSDALNLIKSMLQFNPWKRIKVYEIMEHPFFGLSKLTKAPVLQNISKNLIVINIFI